MTNVSTLYVMHHSHFDLGYTHPQALILELQEAYIDQAIEIVRVHQHAAMPMKWTIEASLPLLKWLHDANGTQITELQDLVARRLISIAALPMHTTPLNDAYQLDQLLQTKAEIETKLHCQITVAINHDVNGQPWTLADLFIDHGIKFYMTGENIHFGGIPFQRPKGFRWQAPTGRLLTSFLGEHYSLFSQFLETDRRDVGLMKAGVDGYLNHLDEQGYSKDYAILTATNPPLLDNDQPDTGLYDLVEQYNAVNPDVKIRFIVPEELAEILESEPLETFSGDWTDFWNFGGGSTPREVAVNRLAEENIKHTDVVNALSKARLSQQEQRVHEQALQNNLIYNEHTWGSADSIDEAQEWRAYGQKVKKATYAYDALAQSAFVLNQALDRLTQTPVQLEQLTGIAYVNTSSTAQSFTPQVPVSLLETRPYLSAWKSNLYLRNIQESQAVANNMTLAPYQTAIVSVDDFQVLTPTPLTVESEYAFGRYQVNLDVHNGLITQITDLERNQQLLDSDSEYGFFDLVLEQIDTTNQKNHRSTFFPRDIDLANYSISVWNHNWQANRTSYQLKPDIQVTESGSKHIITVTYQGQLANLTRLQRVVTFDDDSGEITVDIFVDRSHDNMPNADYLTVPLQLESQWQACFESANTFVELDDEQLGNVSKDWVTIDRSAAMYDQHQGIYLATTSAPLICFNGFTFGHESKQVKRDANPLMLSWIYNNYWNTNFNESDDGRSEHHYLLKPFTQYATSEQNQLGVKATRPVVGTWADKLQFAGDQTLTVESNVGCEVLHLEKNSDTIEILVKNYTKTIGELSLRFNSMGIGVPKVKTDESMVEIKLENDLMTLKLKGNAITSIVVGID